MKTKSLLPLALAALGLCASAGAHAEHLDETTQEVRTVLYYHVPPATLAKFLPPGWVASDFASGPAAGANLTVNLSDQLASASPKGVQASDARGQGITLSARVRDPQTGENRAMVLLGFTNGVDSPGPYGLHRKASIDMTRSARTLADGQVGVSEHWSAHTALGDALEIDLKFMRGPLAPLHVDQQTRSSLHPAFYRIYKMDQQTDVVLSSARRLDHVTELKVSEAGQASALLGAQRTPVAIVSVPVFHREIWLPD